MKTKAQELAVLDEAIAKLGDTSYLGPWLMSVRAEVERDIRSDFVPMLLPSEALRQAAAIKEQAIEESGNIVAKAARDAEAVLARVKQECEREKQWALRQVDEARARLERV